MYDGRNALKNHGDIGSNALQKYKRCQKMPKDAKICQKMPKNTKNCEKDDKILCQ